MYISTLPQSILITFGKSFAAHSTLYLIFKTISLNVMLFNGTGLESISCQLSLYLMFTEIQFTDLKSHLYN